MADRTFQFLLWWRTGLRNAWLRASAERSNSASNRHRRVRRYRYHSGIDVGRVAAVAAIESVKRR